MPAPSTSPPQRPAAWRRPPAGFTLAEMIIVLAIVAVTAAIVLTALAGRARSGTAGALAQSFNALSTAVQQFRGDVRRYPGRLDLLSAAPVAGDDDVCGTALSPAARNRWQGPYLQRPVPAAGLPAGDATILNDVQRSPATATPQDVGTLFIVAVDVDATIAEALEREFDGNADYTDGAIRYITGGATDTLKYAMPIRGC